jgi:hypothetical protein
MPSHLCRPRPAPGINQMPLEVPPSCSSRFGSPLVLSRVHWVRPELVAEVKYLAWTGDNLPRQVVYGGLAKISLRPGCAARCRVRSDRCVRRRDAIMCGKFGCFNCIGPRLLAVRRPHRSQ